MPDMKQRWYHVNGHTECVAGHDAWTGECADGGGPVLSEVEHLRSVLDRAIQGREMARIERNALKAALERVRAAAEDMRTWCSPHGVAVRYADHILGALDHPTDTTGAAS